MVRGGMNICEQTEDGRRKYVWIKVKPTKTDDESSIALALARYRATKDAQNKRAKPLEASKEKPAPPTPQKDYKTKANVQPKSLLQRIKEKLWEIWQQIDEVVIE